MIRRLMASTAVLALITTGAWTAQAQTNNTNTQQPAAAEQPAAGTDQGATAAAPDTNTATANAPAGQADATLTPDQPTLATAFIGRSVYSNENPDSDKIGDVNDLIIGENGEITDAVVGVGGFLGIGEKDVAVPFKELQVVERDGDIRLIYAATKEQLEAAQAFDRTAYDPRARFQENQANQAANQPADTTGIGGTTAPAAGTTDTMAAAPANDNAAATTDQQNTNQQQAAATTDQQTTDQQQAAATTTQQTTTTAGSEGFLSYNADQVRASTLMGKELYGPDNQSIGEVSDLVLQEDGKTRAAIVDVGGFLGVGEKRVAIPFDQIQISPDPQDNNKPKLVVAMTKDQLEQAPAWQDRTMGSDQANNANANQNAATTDQQANNNMAADQNATTDQQANNNAAATDQNAAANNQQANNNAANQNAAGQQGFVTATQDISADKLIGTTVYGTNDENIGEVGDVVFDKAGAIEAVVIDVGGFLGMGEKPVAVQFDALNVQKDTNGDVKLMINASEDQLKNAPAYNEQASATTQTVQ